MELVRSSSDLTSELGRSFVLITKSFRVSPESVLGMHAPGNETATTLQEVLGRYLEKQGFDFAEGSDQKFFFNDRTGVLTVRAFRHELERLEQLLKVVNEPAGQVKLQVRMAEFRGELLEEDLKEPLEVTKIPGTLHDVAQGEEEPENAKRPRVWTKVLTEPQMKVLMRALEQREGVDLASTPNVTTLSGRAARMAVEESPVITDPPFTAPGKEMKARWSWRNH